MKVSIISPIYKGKRYIASLIEQAETCKIVAGQAVDVELILSNDYPNEPLETYESNIIKIIVLNAEDNGGIQKARIRGLEVSNGDYITFLDQDDKLYPEYIKSQLGAIGDVDAVVCRCINEGRLNFNVSAPFEKMITREYMLTKGDPIVSTGSVMIRRTSIPEVWKENILQTSGADDYFLWLCMLAENCVFALNQEVVFEHIVNGINTSLDTQRMLRSERELFETIKKLELFKGEEAKQLDLLEKAIVQRQIRLLDKFRLMFFTLNNLMALQEEGITLHQILLEREISHLAIYGAGYVGNRIYGLLKNTDVRVECFVDQNAEFLDTPVPACKMDNIPTGVDGILVTLLQGADAVAKELHNLYPKLKTIEISELTNI